MLEITEKNTTAAMRTLALVKALRSKLDIAEKNAKAYLAQVIEEGDSFHALAETGENIGTISRSKEGAPTYIVEDVDAYIAWHEEHGLDHEGVPTYVFPKESLTAEAVAEKIADTGEVPAGMTEKPGRAATMSVRQTAKQAESLLNLLPGSGNILKVLQSLEGK